MLHLLLESAIDFENVINKENVILWNRTLGEGNIELFPEIKTLSEEDMIAYSIIEKHNSGQIKIGREIVRSIEDKLKNTTNKKLLYSVSIILYGNSEFELADEYFLRISTNKGAREFAMACGIYGNMISL